MIRNDCMAEYKAAQARCKALIAEYNALPWWRHITSKAWAECRRKILNEWTAYSMWEDAQVSAWQPNAWRGEQSKER